MRLNLISFPVFRPITKSNARYKGIHGGRGSGKSHFAGEYFLGKMIAGHRRVVFGREVQRSIADSSKQLLEDKIRQFGMENDFIITDSEIRYPKNESLAVFKGLLSHTAASIKSLEKFHDLCVDEAQQVSQYSLDIVTPTFRQPDSEMLFLWNRVSPEDAVDKLFVENKDDDDFLCIEANYDSNKRWHLSGLVRDMERDRDRDPDKYAHVWAGGYRQKSQARVFHNWKTQDFVAPDGVRFYYGADWGYSTDPTVLVRCYIDENARKIWIDYEAYKVGCEIDHRPQLFEKVPGSKSWPIRADSSDPAVISYMQRNGYPKLHGAKKGKGSVEEGVEFLKSYDIIVHSRCINVINELSFYSYEVDKKTQEILPTLKDKDNHIIDALRYALEGFLKTYKTPKQFDIAMKPKLHVEGNRYG